MVGRRDEEIRRWRLVRAGTDAVPSSVRRFMSRARERRLRAAVPWGLFLLVIAVLGGLGWLVYGSPVLGVRQIEVRGATIVSADEVRAAAAVAWGTPLAAVDSQAVADRVARLAPVASAVVDRSWPDTLVISVVERTPMAAVARDRGRFELLDGQGVIFRTVSRPPKGVVLVRFGDQGQDGPSTRAALSVIAALTPKLRSELEVLVVDGPARIKLELRADRVITWGDADQSELKAKVASALLARSEKLIDVSAPDVVTLK